MSKRSSDLLLLDMKEAAEKILKYTKGLSFEDFLADDKTIDAVVRNFEIIGEASLRIDKDFRFEHPQIEWKKLRGFRNRIVHDYFGD
uniref:HepT-like ribonuclease domain-containing protein n=1 Tax=Algoriphagus sp. TaxID=1872435 RepID=UPI0040470BE8